MPFPFLLPTTSHLPLSTHATSPTHPSLVLTATTHRSALRNALKQHKRLPPASQSSNLLAILSALSTYLPYIHTILNPPAAVLIERATTGAPSEWRPTLSPPPPGLTLPPRAKVPGLDADYAFTLLTLAQTHYLIARSSLLALHTAHTSASPPSADQRTTALASAMKHLVTASSILAYASTLPALDRTPLDIQPPTLAALSELALAEATLLATAKEDPYPAAASAALNPHDKDWMVGAPSMSKVRAHLFARLCVAAAEHAARASAGLAGGSVTEELARYADTVQRVARAKACRFLAVDAEGQGESGTALGWIGAALSFIGEGGSGSKGLSGLRAAWSSRTEDRKLAKGGAWGSDGGRMEEVRVAEMLKTKWERSNSVIGYQDVPAVGSLVATLPAGREYHSPAPWKPDGLDETQLGRLRAPATGDGGLGGESSGDEDEGVPGRWVEGREGYY